MGDVRGTHVLILFDRSRLLPCLSRASSMPDLFASRIASDCPANSLGRGGTRVTHDLWIRRKRLLSEVRPRYRARSQWFLLASVDSTVRSELVFSLTRKWRCWQRVETSGFLGLRFLFLFSEIRGTGIGTGTSHGEHGARLGPIIPRPLDSLGLD